MIPCLKKAIFSTPSSCSSCHGCGSDSARRRQICWVKTCRRNLWDWFGPDSWRDNSPCGSIKLSVDSPVNAVETKPVIADIAYVNQSISCI